MPLVLAENEATESGISYHDRTGVSYQFPKMYRRLIQPGERFVYYKGCKTLDGRRTRQVYFGTGIIGQVWADKGDSDRYVCEILDYAPFDPPVFFRTGKNSYLEPGGVRKGYFQRGVRTISETEFDAIIALAASQSSHPTSLTTPAIGYGTPETNLQIERFAVEQAVLELQNRFPGAAIIPQPRNNPGFDIFDTHRWQDALC